jgi:hypothetical protein
MIQFKKFYIKDGLQEELTKALDETHNIPLHPSLSIISEIDLSPITRSWFRLLRMCALKPIPTEDDEAIEFFSIENKTEEQLYCLKTIRHKFNEFRVQNDYVLTKTITTKSIVDTYFNLTIEVIKHKHMITNEHYGFSGFFKSFILHNIRYMYMLGIVSSFIVFCEFCPDFICDDCYPMFNKFSACYKYSLELVLKNEFMYKLFNKHFHKWSKYILTQS